MAAAMEQIFHMVNDFAWRRIARIFQASLSSGIATSTPQNQHGQ
jgi:hypothetical protein